MIQAALNLIAKKKKFEPFGGAKELFECDAPEVLIAGPAGTGKSRACLEKLHYHAQMYPRSRYLIVRKTRESLSESALFTFERFVLGLEHPLVQNGPERRNRQVYKYDNGSEIIVGGLKTSGKDTTEKIMSTEYDMIYVPEAIELTEEEWERLTTRNRNFVTPYQQVLADTNPSSPTHWLKRRADKKQTKLIESQHEDNPMLWDRLKKDWTEKGKKYIAVLDALTGIRKLRLRFGKWVQAEGVIYEQYDPNIHLIDAFPIPSTWRKFRAIDFGLVNPFVCGWFAMDEDGRMYLYRQIYMTKRTVKVHSETILNYSQGERIETTVCDHDAEDRATLAENDIPNEPARKAISVGIEKVQERLKLQADGRPRLYIFRDCLVETDELLVEAKKPFAVEQEIDGYVWKDKTKKEQPIDENNHGMDMLRYAVMYEDGDDGDSLKEGANNPLSNHRG